LDETDRGADIGLRLGQQRIQATVALDQQEQPR
jgi:hypothetical protein